MSEVDHRRDGRPRDPTIRAKVLLATQRVYLANGLAGVTFEAVAREAGVGKPAVYRRWSSTDDLMADVLASHVLEPLEAPSDDIRGQLAEIATSLLLLLQSETGDFVLRVISERGSSQGVFDRYLRRVREVIHSNNRSLVVAAVERGDLPTDTDPDVVLQAVTGAILVGHLMALTPPPENGRDAAAAYCRRVIDQILVDPSRSPRS